MAINASLTFVSPHPTFGNTTIVMAQLATLSPYNVPHYTQDNYILPAGNYILTSASSMQ